MCWLVIRFRGSDPAFIQSYNILCLIYFSPRGLTLCPHEVPLSPKLDRNATETSTSGFPYFRTLNNVSWFGSRAARLVHNTPIPKRIRIK
jgi:hypothetical protein